MRIAINNPNHLGTIYLKHIFKTKNMIGSYNCGFSVNNMEEENFHII